MVHWYRPTPPIGSVGRIDGVGLKKKGTTIFRIGNCYRAENRWYHSRWRHNDHICDSNVQNASLNMRYMSCDTSIIIKKNETSAKVYTGAYLIDSKNKSC